MDNPDILISPLQEYLQNLPEHIDKAKTNQIFHIDKKYKDLLTTIKPLKDLIQKYKQQVTLVLQKLEKDHHIDRLSVQAGYFRQHVEYLQKIMEGNDREEKARRKEREEKRICLMSCRKELCRLRLENVQLAMALQKKNIKKQEKIEKSRKEYEPIPSFQPITIHKENMVYLDLQQQILRTTLQKIQQQELQLYLWRFMRTQLIQDQKRTHNGNGLVGSMYFKLTNGKKQPTARSRRSMDHELKFLVYDSLRRKYQEAINKQKEAKADKYEISYSKWLAFSMMQMIGFMELHPHVWKILEDTGLKKIKDLLTKSDCV